MERYADVIDLAQAHVDRETALRIALIRRRALAGRVGSAQGQVFHESDLTRDGVKSHRPGTEAKGAVRTDRLRTRPGTQRWPSTGCNKWCMHLRRLAISPQHGEAKAGSEPVIALLISIPTFSPSSLAAARDGISIVGPSTVFPFSAAVAEDAGRGAKFKRRKAEPNATRGGGKLVSEGVGVNRSAITNASRPIKESEHPSCTANGAVSITEGNIGFHGIVLAEARFAASINPTLKDFFTALTEDVPDAHGKLIPDPNKIWKDVNRSLPDIKAVLGPSPTSATRDAFAERAMAAEATRDLFPMGHRTH